MTPSLPGFNLPGLFITAVQEQADLLILTAGATAARVPCPTCAQVATRIHSHYIRTLADLPAQGRRVRLVLQVRRFFCPTPTCPRTTFVEQIPALTAPHAQRTSRLNDWLAQLGLALGGEAGARLGARLQLPASPDTLLRRVHKVLVPPLPTPRVLGVDDWAWRKGRQYGTILCDLERHCPVDLLPDRSAATFAAWLRVHPGVEIISRDRATVYAEGATQGAPQAIQVADRFHLLKNLTEAVEEVLKRHRADLQRTAPPLPPAPAPPVGAALAAPPPPAGQARRRERLEAVQLARRAARLARYEQIRTLHTGGVDRAAIAARVGVSVSTVTRFLRTAQFPERRPRHSGPSDLDPYLPYLLQRWDAGCHQAIQLWRAIGTQGYRHSRALVYQYVARLRQGERPLRMAGLPPESTSAPAVPFYTPRAAVWLMLRPPQDLSEVEAHDLAGMHTRSAELAQVYQLAQEFRQLVRKRQAEGLEAWLNAAAASTASELRSFANGIARDKAAVLAGLTLPWSNGPVEGQVNRLKLIKRQMYGRAKFDLLRQRVLQRG